MSTSSTSTTHSIPIPQTTYQQSTNNHTVASPPSIPTPSPALRSFLTRLTESTRRAFSRRRPWLELIDRNSFSRPTSLAEATTRVRKNASYFKINYLTILAAVLAFSLFSHPFSLLTLLTLLAAWLFLYIFRPSDQPLVILERTFSDRETLGILIVVTIFVVFLTNIGSLLMSASLIGCGIVCVHGAFRDPEDLFLDDQELPGSGFFSTFVGNAASSAAVAAMAPPAVASRV